MDFAKRAYDHSFHIDAIVRSLLDTDFYKLLMLQFIWKYFPKTEVEFAVTNRTKNVRLRDVVDENELRAQLNYARNLTFTEKELVWLAGNKFYGRRDIFAPEFIEFLRTLRLPDYQLAETADGQWDLRFRGSWAQVTLWEIIAIMIVNTLRNRAALAFMNKRELDLLYARAKVKAHDKTRSFNLMSNLNLIDFGTRRRHDYLWQKWNVELYADALGKCFGGTSNALIAMELGLEAKGTNAHELPMVLTALAGEGGVSGHGMVTAQYAVLEMWEELYGENLRIFLPDTYGTTQFLASAPDWVAKWKGARPDSKPPLEAVGELIKWWVSKGENPQEKLVLPCDGLDVGTIRDVYQRYDGKVGLGFGYGTWFSNDFRNCHPNEQCYELLPISLVCKVSAVRVSSESSWVPAVKLSDNFDKATGPSDEVSRYRQYFGTEGVSNVKIEV